MDTRGFSRRGIWASIVVFFALTLCEGVASESLLGDLDEIGSGWNYLPEKNDSEGAWRSLSSNRLKGKIVPPELIEKTFLDLAELPIGYVQAGEVVLGFVLDEKGEIMELKFLPPFRGELPDAIVDAIMKWKFTPLMQNGEAIPCAYTYRGYIHPIRVSIQEGELVDVSPKIKNLEDPYIFILGDEEEALKQAGWGPRPRHSFYPRHIKGYHRFGKLLLSGIVNKKGRLKKVKIVNSEYSEHRMPVKKTVRKWRFTPGMKNGEAVSTKVWINYVIYPPHVELINEEEGLNPPLVLKAISLMEVAESSIRFGEISLAFIIDEEGKIKDLKIEHCNVPELEIHAYKTFMQWEFQPGFKDGKAVKTRARYSTEYQSGAFLP
ncbi:MAG: energy transducer TonB [Opitutaceae bacterium]|nr:energy transducer TonB [Opitutaceae bacterium]